MNSYFETKVRYSKAMEDGKEKTVTETYIVDGVSFTDVEARIIKEMRAFISGDFEVDAITKTKYSELVKDTRYSADKWFKCKLMFISLDERNGKEKETAYYYLVKAGDLENAKNNINDFMKTSSADYKISSISETPILDVYEYSTV